MAQHPVNTRLYPGQNLEGLNYDNAGNITQLITPDDTLNFRYDAENRLKRVDFADGNYEEYVYNALGERVQIKRNGQLIQRLLYDGLMVPVALVDSSGASEYLTRGPGAGGIGGLIANGSEYYHYNHRGDVVNSDSASYTYDAFGHVMSATTPLFGHSTKPLDPATGFSWFGFRHYAPGIGRWLTRDPIGFAGGMNFYAYVGNNPVNAVDFFGLFRFGRRMLFIPTLPPIPGLSYGNSWLDCANIEISHQHGFFGENLDENDENDLDPSLYIMNIGYFDYGLGINNENINAYHLEPYVYDDNIMREALSIVLEYNTYLPYSLTGDRDGVYRFVYDDGTSVLVPYTPQFNCQDFSDVLRNVYFMLGGTVTYSPLPMPAPPRLPPFIGWYY